MIRVFIVEDEVTIRESIEKMVPWEECGFELVGDASDGEIALPKILDTKPDVLITDIKMPFMNGLDLSREIKKKLPNIKIIILSGHDDFEYAKMSIEIGVERYLTKPVTRKKFIEVLNELRDKFEMEKEDYQNKFIMEMQGYEQYSRRDFFEKLLHGDWSLQEIYDKAEELKLDMMAETYCVVLFMMEAADDSMDYSDELANLHEKVEKYITDNHDYVLFRFHSYGYGVVVKGKTDNIEEKRNILIERLQGYFAEAKDTITWNISVGEVVERVSKLKDSYKSAEKMLVYRYINSDQVLYAENIESSEEKSNNEQLEFDYIDVKTIGQEVLMSFLTSGIESEISDFVDEFFEAIGKKALKSLMFRQYIVLHIRFCVFAFLERIGSSREELFEEDFVEDIAKISCEVENIKEYVVCIIKKAYEQRNKMSGKHMYSVINKAVEYLSEHYADEDISLNVVASKVNVSANHFSAMFSQKMGKTFVEYMTELRMNRAKELLVNSDMKLNEIAYESGYKDSHYFSYLFKKLQGCTPSDYRNRKREEE